MSAGGCWCTIISGVAENTAVWAAFGLAEALGMMLASCGLAWSRVLRVASPGVAWPRLASRDLAWLPGFAWLLLAPPGAALLPFSSVWPVSGDYGATSGTTCP